MAFNILMPLSSKPKGSPKPLETDWKAKYKEAIASIDYNRMRELEQQNKTLRYRLRECHKIIKGYSQNFNEINVQNMEQEVCLLYNITLPELLGKKSRSKNIHRARAICTYIMHKTTDSSFPVLGRRYGNTDHSSAIHRRNTIENDLQTGQMEEWEVEILTKYCK